MKLDISKETTSSYTHFPCSPVTTSSNKESEAIQWYNDNHQLNRSHYRVVATHYSSHMNETQETLISLDICLLDLTDIFLIFRLLTMIWSWTLLCQWCCCLGVVEISTCWSWSVLCHVTVSPALLVSRDWQQYLIEDCFNFTQPKLISIDFFVDCVGKVSVFTKRLYHSLRLIFTDQSKVFTVMSKVWCQLKCLCLEWNMMMMLVTLLTLWLHSCDWLLWTELISRAGTHWSVVTSGAGEMISWSHSPVTITVKILAWLSVDTRNMSMCVKC